MPELRRLDLARRLVEGPGATVQVQVPADAVGIPADGAVIAEEAAEVERLAGATWGPSEQA